MLGKEVKMKCQSFQKKVLALCCVVVSMFSLGADAAGSGIASDAWSAYKGMLSTNPVLTKSVTSSTIMTCSDIICQQLVKAVQAEPVEEGNEDSLIGIDLVRVLQVTVTGLIWSGPITHLWYSTLEKIVRVDHPLGGLLLRMLLDAVIFSPIAVTGYFTVRSILEGSGLDGIQDKLSTRFVPALQGSWKFWPAANIINFSMIPVQYRVLYSNVLSLFWSGYLTLLNARKTTTKNQTQ